MIEYLAMVIEIKIILYIVGFMSFFISMAMYSMNEKYDKFFFKFAIITIILATIIPNRTYYCYATQNPNKEFCNKFIKE